MAGIFEELLYRGPIQTALMRKGRPWTAIIIAAVLFAAAHLDLHGLTIRAALGVVLGWVVWRTGSIFPAMLVHGLYDAGTLGLAWWVVRKHGVEGGDTPMFDAATVSILAGGVVLSLAGWWLIRLSKPPEPETPAYGFSVHPAREQPQCLPVASAAHSVIDRKELPRCPTPQLPPRPRRPPTSRMTSCARSANRSIPSSPRSRSP
jgi:hypothetical protein